MDLTLSKIPMEGYACPLETVVYQEETQESIVPDASPDILTILFTEARALLTRKESMEGKAECAGSVRVTVVYLPDGEDGPRRLELDIPFRASSAAAGLTPGCPLVVIPRVTGAETRALNPRKVLCRVELAILCQAWAPREETLCEPCQEEGWGLQQRTEELETYTAMAAVEKPFAFTDDVTLSPSHPPIQELLGHRLELRCGEAKVIGNKLIFKGEATLQCRYRTPENAVALARFDLPFSQIMEAAGVEEEGACDLEVVERESQVSLTGDEECRTLSVHMELLAQAVVRQTRQLQLFTDAYSVTHAVNVERQSILFTQLWEESSVTETYREVIETPTAVRSVEDCFICLGQPQVKREEQEGVMTVQGKATILYTDDAGQLCAMTRPIAISSRVALPSQGECRARCAPAGDVQAVAAGGGIELRCAAQFNYLTTLQYHREAVCALSAEEREETPERPSVILRLAQPGEGLWDIAKAYSTTQADILAANDLPDPQTLEGTLLLIPRSR